MYNSVMSRPGVRLVRCPFQQWRSSTPFSSAAADRRWRAQAFEPRPESRTRPGARKREKQENGAHARHTEIRYCDVIENSWRGRITIGVKMVGGLHFQRISRKASGDRRGHSLSANPVRRARSEKQSKRNRPESIFKISTFYRGHKLPTSSRPSRAILETRPRSSANSRSAHDMT